MDDLRREWSRARVGGLSAEIAFFGLLGLFPAVIVFAAALGSLDVVIGAGRAAADTEQWLLDRVDETFWQRQHAAGHGRGAVRPLQRRADHRRRRPDRVRVVARLHRRGRRLGRDLTATRSRRNWISTRVMGFVLAVFTVLVSALVAAMVVVGPLLGGGEELAERFGAGAAFTTAWDWFRWPVVFVAVVCWAASIYHFAPPPPHPRGTATCPERSSAPCGGWRCRSASGCTSTRAASGMNAVFGLLGGALTLLVWLYLLAMGLLVGAEINSVLNRRRGVGEGDGIRHVGILSLA